MWLSASTAPPVRGTCSLPEIWKDRPQTLKAAFAVTMIGGYVMSRTGSP